MEMQTALTIFNLLLRQQNISVQLEIHTCSSILWSLNTEGTARAKSKRQHCQVLESPPDRLMITLLPDGHIERSPLLLCFKYVFDLRNYHLKDTKSLTQSSIPGKRKAHLFGSSPSPRTSGSHIFLVNSTQIMVTHLLRGHLCSAWHKHAVCSGV